MTELTYSIVHLPRSFELGAFKVSYHGTFLWMGLELLFRVSMNYVALEQAPTLRLSADCLFSPTLLYQAGIGATLLGPGSTATGWGHLQVSPTAQNQLRT